LEQLENALFDDDDGGDMPPPSTSMIPLTRTPITSARPSPSVLPPRPPTQLSQQESAPLPPRGGSRGNDGGTKRKEK
jgi:hypothetical protein